MRLSFPPLKSYTAILAVLCLFVAAAWAAPANKLVISGVPGVIYTGGNPGQVKVTVELASNGSVVNTTASIQLALTGAATQSVTANAVAGVATLNASAWALANGAYTLTATSSGMTSGTATFTVMAPPVMPATAVGSSSAAQSVTFGFTSATTVSGVQVLFQGAANLDYTLGSGAACSGAYAAGATCTVPVVFSPKALGQRLGAVELIGAGSAILQTVYISGQGLGSGVNFPPVASVDADGNATVAATSAQTSIGSNLGYPDAMAFDAQGNLYIADYPADDAGDNNDSVGRVIKLPLVNGQISTAQQTNFSANLNYVDGLAFDGAGNLFVSDYDDNEVIEVPAGAPADGSGNIVLLSNPDAGDTSFVYNPAGLAVDGAGNLFICDWGNNRVIEIPNQSGHLNSAAAIYLGAGLSAPSGIKADPAGNILVADWGNARIVEIPNENGVLNSADETTLVTDLIGQPSDLALDAAGDLNIALEEGNALEVVPKQGGTYNAAATYFLATGLNGPDSVILDNAGNVYFCDTYNQLAYRLDTVDPPALSFPATAIGLTSAAQSVGLLNTGTQPLSINSISFGANFPNQGSTCSGTLASGYACSLVAGLQPTALGAVSQAAVISDNAVNQAATTQSVGMSGSGLQGAQAVVITAPASVAYGTAPIALAASGGGSGNPVTFALVSGPATLSGSQLAVTGVGTIQITASQAGNSLYAAGQASATITVTPALLTVTANPASMVFGAALPSLGYTITGYVNSDTVTVVTGAPQLTTTATSASPVGSYPITAAFGTLAAANYNFVFVAGTLSVTGATPTTTWVPSSAPVVYGNELGAALLDATSSVPGIWVYSNGHVPVNAASVLPVGSYPITAVFTPNDTTDYAKVTLTQTFQVQAAVLTVTASPVSGTYGAAIPALSAYTITGFVHGDTASVVSGSAVLTTTATTTSPAGPYPISVSTTGLSAANYTFTAVPGTLTLSPAIPATTWAPSSLTLPLGSTLASVMNASSPVPGTWAYYIGGSLENPLAIVGSGAWTMVAYFTPTNTQDYAPVSLSLNFTVQLRLITVTATSFTIPYGSAIPALTYSTSGWQSGDGPSLMIGLPLLSTTATSASAPGTYPVSVTVLAVTANNYSFAGVPGTITIVPATPAVSLAPSASGLTYGQPLSSALVASNGVPGAWSFTANGTPVSATSTLSVGSYAIVGTFTPASADYAPVVQTLAGALAVTPASLTVTANSASMTAGAAVPTLTYTMTGFVGTDTQATATTGAPALSTTATASSAAGSYPITVTAGSLAATNYTFTFVPAALTVAAATTLPYTSTTSVSHSFNNSSLRAGSTIWFGARFDASNVNDGTVIAFQNGTITFTANHNPVTVTVPNSTVTFSASATQATTSFNATTQTWVTIAPLPHAGDSASLHHGWDHGQSWGWYGSGRYYSQGYDGQGDYGSLFLDAVAYAVPAGGLPANIQNVTWSGTIASNDSNAVAHWDWSAAAYSSFSANYNSLGVLPATSSQYRRSGFDVAGTPESYQSYLLGSLTSGGGNDYGLDNGWSYTCGDRPTLSLPLPNNASNLVNYLQQLFASLFNW